MSRLVPKLRFKEFSGEWEEKRLGDIGDIITGNTPKTNEPDNYGNEILFVSPADISESRYIYNTNKKLSNKGFLKTRQIKSKSILVVCIGSTIGKVAQSKFKSATNQQINSIIPFDEYNCDFIYSTLEKDAKKIKAIAGNHAVPIINKTEFSSIKILVPATPQEQQKIADTLSSLDNLIEANSKKVEALKKHKKGLMQQLFPTDNEKMPKLRFKEFSGEWEEKELGDLTSLITKGTTPKYFVDNGIRYIKIESINGININEDKCLFIDRNTHQNELKRSILQENDILFAIAGSLGKVTFVKKSNLPANTNQALSIIRLKEKNNLFFILYILQSERIKKYIEKSLSIGAQPNLNLKQMSEFNFYLPHPQEQQKIADTLSSLDNLIEATQKKVEALKEHKKGLMQQMFVSEEVCD